MGRSTIGRGEKAGAEAEKARAEAEGGRRGRHQKDAAEEQARTAAQQAEAEKARAEAGAAAAAAQKRAAEEQARAAAQRAANEESASVWTDRATGLMWAKDSNSSDVSWYEARNYCSSLILAGHSDWKLPAIDALSGIYDVYDVTQGENIAVKGGIRFHGGYFAWSSSAGSASREAGIFGFTGGYRYSAPHSPTPTAYGLCVYAVPGNDAWSFETLIFCFFLKIFWRTSMTP